MQLRPRNPAALRRGTLLPIAAALVAAAPVAADTGGAPAAGQTGGAAYAPASAQAGSAQLSAQPAAILGRVLRVSGTGTPGSQVAVQRFDSQAGAWVEAVRAPVDAQGRFVARWRTDHIGVFSIRAVPVEAGSARASSAAATLRVTVYKPARATWYGPGFYGRRTACGLRMTRSLVGVAHRGLPCGTPVALYYRGRTLTVPVVDRGPYGAGADWDLTAAAARALGFAATDTLGAVSLGRR